MNSSHGNNQAPTWSDRLMVFMVVVTLGSVVSLMLLRDLSRYWAALESHLESVPGRKTRVAPDKASGVEKAGAPATARP